MGESRRPHPQQTAAKQIERAERDAKIVRLARRGKNTAEIMMLVECGQDTVRRAKNAALEAVRDELFTDQRMWVAQQVDRLSALLDAGWDDAMAGSTKHMAECRQIVSLIGDFTGSKAPSEVIRFESSIDADIRRLTDELERRARAAEGEADSASGASGGGRAVLG